MSDDDEFTDVATLLDDGTCRRILAETSVAPCTANDLAERLDVDISTVYRKLDQLEAADLVTSAIEVRTDGHHPRRYRSRFRRLQVELVDGEYNVTVDRVASDPADRLADLFEEIR